MSYCRFSTNDFQCDLYCYFGGMGEEGAYITHVANTRPVFTEVLPPKVSIENIDAWLERDRKVSKLLDEAERRPIGLPHDGENFIDGSIYDFYNRLVELREAGYQFPDDVLEAVKEEIAEEVYKNSTKLPKKKWSEDQKKIFDEAVDLFQQVLEIPWMKESKKKRQFHLRAIKDIYPVVFAVKENEDFDLWNYARGKWGEEKLSDFMGGVVPYITGERGVLKMHFQHRDKTNVEVLHWQLGKEYVRCLQNGKEVPPNEILVLFKRNQRGI